MAGTIKKLAGPLLISVASTAAAYQNIFNATSTAVYSILRHIHIANVDTAAAYTFCLNLDTSGGKTAGTELFTGVSIAAGSYFDWYGALKVVSTDFLTGGASTANKLTITVEGEQVVV